MEFTRKIRARTIGVFLLMGATAFVSAPFMVGRHPGGAVASPAGLAFASFSSAHAEAYPLATARLDTASALNLMGQQRMLSQRMVKAYLMLGQGIAAEDARIILQGSITEFEANLATLKTFQPTPAVRGALARLGGAWAECKALLAAAPSKAGAIALYDANEAMQDAAHSAALAYEGVTLAPLDHLANIMGHQHMLSQRMAKFYFYRTWGLYDDPAYVELHLTRARFTAELNQIESSPLASAETKAGVARIRREWEPYQQLLFANREPAAMRRDAIRVAELSERVSAATEALVAQFTARGTPR